MQLIHYIPLPVRDTEKPFLMPVEDVFSITGRGTVATGRIETGVINTGDPVDIIGMGAEKLKSVVTGVEMFRKILDRGEAGDNAGLLLRGIDKDDIRRGMVIAKPGSITPHKHFKAERIYPEEKEGGRHTPFHNNTVRSSISVLLMLPVKSYFLQGVKWLCREITLRSTVELDFRNRYEHGSAFCYP